MNGVSIGKQNNLFFIICRFKTEGIVIVLRKHGKDLIFPIGQIDVAFRILSVFLRNQNDLAVSFLIIANDRIDRFDEFISLIQRDLDAGIDVNNVVAVEVGK